MLNWWKDKIESQGMIAHVNKTKALISADSYKEVHNIGRQPCVDCGWRCRWNL